MPKLLPKKKQLINLPKEKEKKYLPKPEANIGLLVLLALLPIIFILIYALSPWFTISSSVVNGIIIGVMGLFLLSVIYLMVATVQFMFYSAHNEIGKLLRVENHIKLTLLMSLSLMFLPVLIHIVRIE